MMPCKTDAGTKKVKTTWAIYAWCLPGKPVRPNVKNEITNPEVIARESHLMQTLLTKRLIIMLKTISIAEYYLIGISAHLYYLSS
jgi:hypothetical protein